MSDSGLLPHTSLRAFAEGADWKEFHSGVSLHAHTHHSREVLSDLPPYISRIPLLGSRFDRELERRRALNEQIDFSKGWWHPPVTPQEVFACEASQIENRLRLAPIVSLTDHDNIAAGLELQAKSGAASAPISFEWTVPYHEGFFHLGVHDLPRATAADWFTWLSAHTLGRVGGLEDILNALHADGVLVVFNHPLWDLACVGEALHTRRLRDFLGAHQRRIHAVEINGYRSRSENGGVRRLSRDRGLPLISGGDRHARAANAVLNVTRARKFADFAAEVRDGVSHVVVMPEYQEHLGARIVASANDVLAPRRQSPAGWQRWTDRVSCESASGIQSLSYHWPGGGPLWVRSAIVAFQLLTAAPMMRVWQTVLRRFDGGAPVSPIPLSS